MKHYWSQDYNQKIALDEFKKAAKQGNAFCQYQVGLMYEGVGENNYIGTWIDYDKAFKYYNKAANQGLAIAQIKLGSMYFYGEYVSQKFEKAFEYFEKAASQENPHAQLMLGHMFEHGKGTIQNFEKAFEYYEKAASQNQIGALMHLGRMYENGIGTDIDLEKAFEYYKKVDVFNVEFTCHPNVQDKLQKMYKDGIGTEKNLQKSQEYVKKSCLISNMNGSGYNLFGEDAHLPYKCCKSLKEADFIFEIGNERKKKMLKKYIEDQIYSFDEENIELLTKYFDESSEIIKSIAVKRQLDDTTESSISLAKKSR